MATMRVTTTERSVTVRQMLPVISASTFGTAIEWYDFFFYSFLAAFSTNFVGFVARPLGGAFFGWFGDSV